jgi:YgiT-type zinc finger domain-containing protein
MTTQCPICELGQLEFLSANDNITYKNKNISVNIEYAVCAKCHEEMILPEQIKRNDSRVKTIIGYLNKIAAYQSMIGRLRHRKNRILLPCVVKPKLSNFMDTVIN